MATTTKKRAAEKGSFAEKSPAKSASAMNSGTAAKKTGTAPKAPAVKKKAAKQPAKKSVAKSTSKAKSAANYTKPELREEIKREVIAGDKGGRPGQWSARKAQIVAHEYEAKGGGYKHERTEEQKSLKDWGDEKWHTADGKKAIQGEETHRYLPDAAWKELSPEERKATDKKKVQASRKGKQFVKNTEKASEARKHAEKK